MKKATMKNIAEQAGVSIATVSYVLNNNDKEKINQDTKDRILDIAKELNYVPNLTARSLVSKKSQLVGIIIAKDYETEGPWKKNFYSSYINELERMLYLEGYHLLIANTSLKNPDLDIVLQRQLEAVFVVDVDESFFYKISNNFTVPIIVIDSIIDDGLFYKILPDFKDSIDKALKSINDEDVYLITDKFNNDKIMNYIIENSNLKKENIYVMESLKGIEKFLENRKDKKGIILSEYVALIAARYVNYKNLTVISVCGDLYLLPEDTAVLEFDILKKAQKSVELMKDILNKKYRGSQYLILKTE